MSVPPTSLLCYKQIIEEGLLSRMAQRVFEQLALSPLITGRELDQILAAPGEKRTSYHKRLSELERRGVVRVAGERVCTVTGRISNVWEIVDVLPAPVTKPLTGLEKAAERAMKALSQKPQWSSDEAIQIVRAAILAKK